MLVVRKPVSDLSLDPANARKHSKANLEAIKGSLAKFGQQKPIVINDKNIVIAGNGTLHAAKDLGWDSIDCVVTTLKKGYEEMAFALADNRTAELAEWDDEILNKSLQSLHELDFDLSAIGFDDFDPLKGDIAEGLTDPDEVPEVDENKFSVKLGDVWQLGTHRLMCGDSTVRESVERLMHGEKADLVFTDPPYGIDYQDVKGKHKKIKNDKSVIGLLGVLDGIKVPMFVCCNWRCMPDFLRELPSVDFKCCIVWDKGSRVQNLDKFGKQHEFILYAGPYGGEKTIDVDIWSCKREVRKDHPTAKPVELICRAFSSFSKAKNVFEPFCGSGSTLIACEKTGRKCFGMELDPHYCSVIIERWEQFTGKKGEKIHG